MVGFRKWREMLLAQDFVCILGDKTVSQPVHSVWRKSSPHLFLFLSYLSINLGGTQGDNHREPLFPVTKRTTTHLGHRAPWVT